MTSTLADTAIFRPSVDGSEAVPSRSRSGEGGTIIKEIKAIVQPHMLAHVVDALKEMLGLPGVTVSEVRGFGKSRADGAQEKIVEDSIGYAKKAKIEIVVPDDLVEAVLATIEKHAWTGRPGDGKIFVSAVEEVIKIRSGERGGKAI